MSQFNGPKRERRRQRTGERAGADEWDGVPGFDANSASNASLAWWHRGGPMALCDEQRTGLDLEVSEGRRTAVVRATGEVDVASSNCPRSTLAQLVRAGRDLVLDLRGVRFMDASGVGVLLGAYRLARASGRTFVLRRPSPAVTRLLKLTGALRVVPLEATA